MKQVELLKILNSDNKLTVNQVKDIVFELKQDCFDTIYCMHGKENSVEDLIVNRRYYLGEINAFYICLDLLEKLEVD